MSAGTSASTAILSVMGPDQKGLVARISDFIYRHNGSILHAEEHLDQETKLFLMRVEWDLKDFALPREEIAGAFDPLAQELGLEAQLRFSDGVPKTAIFVTRLDHCLYDLLLRHRAGELRADFSLVISNHPDLRPVAESFGVEYLFLPVTKETKPAQEARVRKELEQRRIEFIILARYMQILSEDFVHHYRNRIINIYHSFLPAFAGPEPHREAFQRGVKLIGATAHYVTAELEKGPIIAQDVIPITHRDSVEDLIRKGRDVEKIVLAQAVRLHLENRILVYGNKTVVFD